MKRHLLARFGFGRGLAGGLGPAGRPHGFVAGMSPTGAPGSAMRLLETATAITALLAIGAARREARSLINSRRETTGEMLSMRDAMAEVGAPDISRHELFHAQVAHRFAAAGRADTGYDERLVWFWGNHFAVSRTSGAIGTLAPGPFEVEAIRPNVAGSFADMLLAVSMHWAMLRYLNGAASIGPVSRTGLNRDVGLNEDWAREILELHTLGVDGGYGQDDVLALAKILTGWQFHGMRSDEPGSFRFQPSSHEPGPKTLLGKTYSEDGFEQGVAALSDLARHPSTARHLATKLARHFIADEQPERLVRELAAVFLETDGDLAAVSQALIGSKEAEEAPPRKLRLPQEFLVAMLRATGVELEPPLIDQMCRVMGQPVWEPPGPDGFPDTIDYWLSPEGMTRRLDVAIAVAERVDPTLKPMDVLEVTMGDIASDETRLAVARAESRQQAFALLFMSPEFQWR